MDGIKRAGLYLVRKKRRVFLLLCIFLGMSFSVLIGISFKNSAENQLDKLRKSMASGFVFKANVENKTYWEHVDFGNAGGSYIYNGPRITEEMIGKILSLDGVKDYTVDLSHVGWTDLTLKPGVYAASKPDPDPDPNELLPYSEEYLMLWRHTVDVNACRDGDMHINFRMGALTIKDGRNIEVSDHLKVVISDWLAEKNHLSVGDTITLQTKRGNYSFSSDPLETLGSPVEVEIAGLFHANFSMADSSTMLETCYIENVIYTDMYTYTKLQENLDGSETNGTHVSVEFLVEDPGEIDSIIQKIESWGDTDLENLEFEVDKTNYQAAAKPYSQIRIFAILLLALGLCGLGTVLYLALKLWVQGRKREIGILYCIGIKKRSVLGQMLLESLAVSAVAVVLAVMLSSPLIDRCVDAAERLTAPKANEEAYRVNISRSYEPVITKLSSDEVVLEAVVHTGTIGFTTVFVCGISCISVFLSFLSISSLEPKNLLQSM